MKQFVLSHPVSPGQEISLRGKDFHYLATVKRLQPGDTFLSVDPEQKRQTLTVVEKKPGVLRCRVSQEPETAPEAPLRIHLYQGLPKGKKMDLVVRQAAECGVMELTPVLTENTIVQPSGRESSKMERWNRIAREAQQQSGQPVPLKIQVPQSLQSILSPSSQAVKPAGNSLFCHEKPLSKDPIPDLIQGPVNLFVGPEGGFSPREVSLFQDAGVQPLYWGPFVLRTETAALYSLAALQTLAQRIQTSEQPCDP